MLKDQKAQAILELAILGSLIIMAFATVISLSENYNRTQSYMQQTFRAALQKAQDVNNAVSWATFDFRRLPNVSNPMEIGELGAYSSTNNVIWSDGKKKNNQETKDKAYFELNRDGGTEIFPPAPPWVGITVSNTGHTSTLTSGTVYIKNERGNNISTQKDLNAQDSVGGTADISGVDVDLGSSLGEGGVYWGGGVQRHTNNTRD